MENGIDYVFSYLGLGSRDNIVEACVCLHGVLTTFVLVMLWMPFVLTGLPSLASSKPFYVGIWLTSRAIAYTCMFVLISMCRPLVEREPMESESYFWGTSFSHQPEYNFWRSVYQRLMQAKTYCTVLIVMAMYVIQRIPLTAARHRISTGMIEI